MVIVRFCMIVSALVLAVGEAFAWGATGHMVVGAIAYESLPGPTKEKIRMLLEHHPAYRTWIGEMTAEDVADTGLYIVMRASRWPDDVRLPKGNTYGHADWHFINYPLMPPEYPNMPSMPGKDLIIGQIAANAATVASKNADSTRAIALSWLIHLIGDLHQPLHSSALVDAMFPNGDMGGNSFFVLLDDRPMRLHSLWDNLLGTTRMTSKAAGFATSIVQSHPRASLPELVTAKTPTDWSLESRQRAIANAYQFNGVRIEESDTEEDAVELPTGYAAAARDLAQRCVALGGYRLADEIVAVME
jgi:hypothetical protein